MRSIIETTRFDIRPGQTLGNLAVEIAKTLRLTPKAVEVLDECHRHVKLSDKGTWRGANIKHALFYNFALAATDLAELFGSTPPNTEALVELTWAVDLETPEQIHPDHVALLADRARLAYKLWESWPAIQWIPPFEYLSQARTRGGKRTKAEADS